MSEKGKFAIFLDIDNTLYVDGVVPKLNKEAIKEARARGNYVFINTARSYGFLPKNLLNEVEVDGVIAGIGTDLRLGEKQIFSKTMSIDEVTRIAKLCYRPDSELIFEGESISIAFNPGEHHRDRCNEIFSVDEIREKYSDAKLSKVFVNRDFSEEEKEALKGTYTLFQHRSYSEFVTLGFSKAEGLKKMALLVGVPIENCIAMGDSANDADMLSVAGTSVAMGDAIESIKEMCDYVSLNACDGGVGNAIYKFVLGIG